MLQLATSPQVSPGVGPRNLSNVPEVDEISLVWTGNGILCSKISETADLVELNQSLNFALWGTVRNGYRERPTVKMTPPTIVQNFGILEEFWRRKQGFISNWLRILSKSIWRGGKMGRGKWYLDTSDKNCCYMGCMRPKHKRFSSAVSSDT